MTLNLDDEYDIETFEATNRMMKNRDKRNISKIYHENNNKMIELEE